MMRSFTYLIIGAMMLPFGGWDALANDLPSKNNVESTKAPLSGKMAPFNYFLGAPWNCTSIYEKTGHLTQNLSVVATFEPVASNVMHAHFASSHWYADSYVGFNSKTKQYFQSRAGSMGGALRETSADGETFRGTSITPEGISANAEDTFKRETDTTYSATATVTQHAANEKATSRCTR